MHTVYREVMMPSEMPATNVVAVRRILAAYSTLCGISEEANVTECG